jgi:energy-coupling factor transporter ATP-binding protein EcfA2
MLKRIRIQNYRLCKDTLIEDMGRIVALMGRNGAGKSNILQAISTTARTATGTDAIAFPAVFDHTSPSVITLEFDLQEGNFKYERAVQANFRAPPPPKIHLSETISKFENGEWKEHIIRSGNTVAVGGRALQIGESSPCLSALATLLPATDEALPIIKPMIAFLSAVHYYPLDESAKSDDERQFSLIDHKSYATWLAAHESTGTAGDSIESVLLRILHMSLTKKEDFDLLKELIGRNSLGLVDDIKIINYGNTVRPTPGASQQEPEAYYGVWFSPIRGLDIQNNLLVPYTSLSIGTRRIIRMFSVMLFDDSSVLLLEQPEDSLHQGMTKKLIGLLRANVNAQLIMSSHSSALFNKLNPDDIQLVSLHDGFTVVRHLTNSERESALEFIGEEGTLYDFIGSLPED